MGPLYVKVLDRGGRALQPGAAVSWPLPRGGQPGGWTEWEPWPAPCRQGWHLCKNTREVLRLPFGTGPLVYLAEAHPKGRLVEVPGVYVVASSARLVRRLPWTARKARLFAVECARRVLPLYEGERRGDTRLAEALRVAARHAAGHATAGELAAGFRVALAAAVDADDGALPAWAGDARWLDVMAVKEAASARLQAWPHVALAVAAACDWSWPDAARDAAGHAVDAWGLADADGRLAEAEAGLQAHGLAALLEVPQMATTARVAA